MCAPYLEKSKLKFLLWFIKCIKWTTLYIWLLLCQILTDLNNYCTAKTRKMYKTGHAFTCLLRKESVANDIINVLLSAGPVCCEPRHRRVESLSVGLCRRCRRTVWTLLMIAILKITMSKWQHCKFDSWRWLSVVLCCERKWTKNNSVFN